MKECVAKAVPTRKYDVAEKHDVAICKCWLFWEVLNTRLTVSPTPSACLVSVELDLNPYVILSS